MKWGVKTVSKLFRTKGWMTISQLTGVWSSELAEGGEDPKQCEQNLVHILIEDILNGRLDDSGPPRDDGRRLGLRCITPDNKPRLIEGRQLRDPIDADRAWVLDHVLVMKEAALDFARQHELPSPSWWADSSTPTEASNDTKLNVAKPNTKALASGSVGKQPRILKYLSEHFPAGVPEPGLYPRKTLQFEILEKDSGLRPLDQGTLKKAIEKYNASLKYKKINPK
jgi:hypothetical protein